MAIRTVSEYARAHGVTERTVRRRIRQGQIPARLVEGPYGPEYHIVDPGDPGADTLSDVAPATLADDPTPSRANDRDPSRSGPPPSPATSDALIQALALADRLSRENVELAGRVGFLQSEVLHLRERIALLEAPKPDPGDPASVEPPDRPAQPANDQDSGAERPVRHRWWRRVASWLGQSAWQSA